MKMTVVQFMQLHTVHGLTNHQNIAEAYTMLPNKGRDMYVEMLTERNVPANILYLYKNT